MEHIDLIQDHDSNFFDLVALVKVLGTLRGLKGSLTVLDKLSLYIVVKVV